ncbi:DNA-directed RNA polymerase III subunit RPC5-like [Haemaphysalis longicornis]
MAASTLSPAASFKNTVAASMASTATNGVEDDDQVVQELDVYISKALANQLYLLQYPHQSTEQEYADDKCIGARVKPKQQKLELEYALDTHDPSYDRARGEQFAENAIRASDGRSDCKDKPLFPSNLMDRQILTSTKSSSAAENYAIGILRPGELHLSPINAILQMRPGYSHLDLSDAKAKAAEAAMEEEDEVEAPKAVTVRFAEQETDRAKKAREKSFRFMQQQKESEPWVEASFHRMGTEMASVERSMLFCPQMDRDMSDLPGTLPQYLQRLVIDKKESSDTSKNAKKATSTQEMSIHALNKLPLQDQIKAILLSAKVVTLAKLMTLLPPKVDVVAVLRQLQQVAMLVRGCWVVKSDVLYPKDTFSPKSGVPAEIMGRARDFLMYLFTQSGHVSRTKFGDTVKLPGEDIKTLLSEMAKSTPEGWEFLLPCDMDFITKFPEVVQRQQMLWDAKQQYLSKSFKQSSKDSQEAVMQSPPAKARQVKRRQRSRHDSTASESSGSESGSATNGPEATKKIPGTKTSKTARASTSSGKVGGHH